MIGQWGGEKMTVKLNKLRALRKQRGISLRKLGSLLGSKSKQYMSELELGNIKLSYDMAKDIADALGLKPDDIFLPDVSNDIGQSTGTEGC